MSIRADSTEMFSSTVAVHVSFQSVGDQGRDSAVVDEFMSLIAQDAGAALQEAFSRACGSREPIVPEIRIVSVDVESAVARFLKAFVDNGGVIIRERESGGRALHAAIQSLMGGVA